MNKKENMDTSPPHLPPPHPSGTFKKNKGFIEKI